MKYLTYEERKKIEKMLRYDRANYRSIGKVLERSHATIIYEVQNNQGHNPYYSAENAHERFLRKKTRKRFLELFLSFIKTNPNKNA